MSWQKCPLCEGTGSMTLMFPSGTAMNSQTCSVCAGQKIIHTISGLPPSVHNKPALDLSLPGGSGGGDVHYDKCTCKYCRSRP